MKSKRFVLILQFFAPHIFGLGVMICFMLLLGCNTSSKESTLAVNTVQSNDVGSVNIQFVGKPEFNSMLNTKTSKKTWRQNYIVFYDNFENDGFEFDEVASKKEVTYTTKSNYIMVRRYLGFFEFQDFLVHKGDSLVLGFDADIPLVIQHSLNNYLSQDFNVDNIIKKKYPDALLITGMADDTRMMAFKHFYDDPMESTMQMTRKGYEKGLYLENLENEMARKLLPKVKSLKTDALMLFDSLHNNKSISNGVYHFYNQKYSNLLLKLEIMSGSMDSIQAAGELNNRYKNQSFSDEYLTQCLDKYEKVYIQSKAKWTVSDQLNLRDPKESFMSTLKINLLSPEVKDQILFRSLNNINAYFPNDIETHLKLFVGSVSDTNLILTAKGKYQKAELKNSTISNLHLMTFDSKQTTIEELMKMHKGKIIYVDFWASWCAPCREAMPASHQLREKLKDKNIAFVYLSLDDKIMAWQRASEKEGLNQLSNSYLIVNSRTSDFLKINKLSEIPRYMIFDKTGNLIYGNAPRVESSEIEGLLIDLAEMP